jgi:Endonuclease/Exonuclease/phosphatase family
MMKFKSLGLWLIVSILIMTGCEQNEPISPGFSGDEETQPSEEYAAFDKGSHGKAITVMTRNVYVGADVDYVLSAQDPSEIPVRVAEAFQMLQATNFPERAEALANEVFWTRPHLIGLQEISMIRIQSPGDAIVGGTVPATDVVYDYLDIFLAALSAKGLHYSVAGIIQNADVEVPMLVNTNPLEFDDVRLTDYDVVLVRNGVQVSNVLEANYQARLIVPIGNTQIEIPRGYVALDATIGSKTYRFVNTHLEPAPIPELIPLQLAQAQELAATLENETKPLIVVGDFNSEATSGDTYQFMVSQDYVDSWTQNLIPFNPDGYTAPHDYNLLNPTVNFDKRIDLIFVKSDVWNQGQQDIGPVYGIVVGDEYWNRTTSGLWPSDHGGVVARLRIPENPS